MKVCIIVEGCYPYTVGGVSSWLQMIIKEHPDITFSVLTLVDKREKSGKFVYEMPENVEAVYEIFLNDIDWGDNRKNHREKRMSKKFYEAFRSLMIGENVVWEQLFDEVRKTKMSINQILMGGDFLSMVKDFYMRKHSTVIFSDFLWTMRSIYLPMLFVLRSEIPQADVYHAIATGYAGVLGRMGKHFYKDSHFMISEHGIYTREREEEIIKSDWVVGIYKDIWIEQFYKMSRAAYDSADIVTSLFEYARNLQIEIGCPAEKTMVTPNGIDLEKFANIPQKDSDDEYINVGSVLRIAPIKDVKTMITAFYLAKQKNDKLRLWLMGPYDEDDPYYQECRATIDNMHITDVIMTGRINVRDYMGKMDMLLLTSISEGQPLVILEAYAAHRPFIATNVGNCFGLIYGERDDYGDAGVVVPIMSTEKIAGAILRLAYDENLRHEMGEVGFRRARDFYSNSALMNTYSKLYGDLYEYGEWRS